MIILINQRRTLQTEVALMWYFLRISCAKTHSTKDRLLKYREICESISTHYFKYFFIQVHFATICMKMTDFCIAGALFRAL